MFSNHHHFTRHSPEEGAESLSRALGKLHEKTAKWVNRLDDEAGRKVWHNYWDTELTYHASYMARLNYTHQNAVKHGLVPGANQYPWCSAAWFERTATTAQIDTIYSIGLSRIKVSDDFDAHPDF